jgi:opacity protein-like surface antigen
MNRILLLAFIAVILMSSMAYAVDERFSADISILGATNYRVSGLFYSEDFREDLSEHEFDFEPSAGLSVGMDYYLKDYAALRADVSFLRTHAEKGCGVVCIKTAISERVLIFLGGRYVDKPSDKEIAYFEIGAERTYEKTEVEYVRIFDVWAPDGITTRAVYYEDEEDNVYFGYVLGGGYKYYFYKRMYVGLGLRAHFLKPYTHFSAAGTIGFAIY